MFKQGRKRGNDVIEESLHFYLWKEESKGLKANRVWKPGKYSGALHL